ncbi:MULTISPECIES: ATP-binding protein [unclassified Streptomyces]|uniref:ATP-binding protein n=1 Tax=unclassified Streptomyces TaxID=2593676 RepID=UPI00343B287C
MLAHALSGGILRDLLRYGLQIREIQDKTQSHELTDLSRHLVLEELAETFAGFRTLLSKQQRTHNTSDVLASFRTLCGYQACEAGHFDANPNIDAATVHTLASCEWIKKSQPLCLIGDSGTGKSHMLISLGTEAAMKGYRVRYTLATKLVNELVEAADEKQLNKTIARYGRVDLLCIDELGYMELDRHGAELLFQVLTEREEKNSVAIASNESFGGWTKTFTDPRLCAAIVDRLTFNGTIIETGTDSYRLASTRARAEETVKAG